MATPAYTPLGPSGLQSQPVSFGQPTPPPAKITAASAVPTDPSTPAIPPPAKPPAPTTPTTQDQTPKPQTTFSSDSGATAAADNAQKLQTLKNTGLTLGPDGLARFSDQSFASAPSDAVQNEDGTWQSSGVKYALGPATSTDP